MPIRKKRIMMTPRSSLAVVLAGVLGLGACTDPSVPTENPKQRTLEGAAAGATLGAITGALLGDDSDSRTKGALVGAVAGGIAGSYIGSRLDKQAQELQQDFDNDRIRVVNTGSELIVTMPQDILFATDSATVSPGLQGDLRVLARSLNDYPDTTVQVIGHTDNTGSAEYNQALSLRRAQSVANVLNGAGVASWRLRAIGRGEDQPVASNYTAEGRAQNRRVEIVIRPTS